MAPYFKGIVSHDELRPSWVNSFYFIISVKILSPKKHLHSEVLKDWTSNNKTWEDIIHKNISQGPCDFYINMPELHKCGKKMTSQ